MRRKGSPGAFWAASRAMHAWAWDLPLWEGGWMTGWAGLASLVVGVVVVVVAAGAELEPMGMGGRGLRGWGSFNARAAVPAAKSGGAWRVMDADEGPGLFVRRRITKHGSKTSCPSMPVVRGVMPVRAVSSPRVLRKTGFVPRWHFFWAGGVPFWW